MNAQSGGVLVGSAPTAAAEEVPAAKRVPADYLPAIDAARTLASIGVVWVHASIDVSSEPGADSGVFGRFRVPFFTLIAVYFAFAGTLRSPQRTFLGYFFSRYARIYLPFLLWSGIYLAMKWLQARTVGRADEVGLGWEILWDGGAYHLWFLPFVFLVTVAAFPVARLAEAMPRGMTVVAILATILGGLSCLVPLPEWKPGRETFFLYLWALPSFWWGIVLGCLYARSSARDRGLAYAWVGLALLIVCTVGMIYYPRPQGVNQTDPSINRLLENLSGIGCALFGLSCVNNNVISYLASYGKYTYGIYLSHIFFLGACRFVARKFGLDTTLGFAAGATIVALIASYALTRVLMSRRSLRWLVS